MCTQKDNEIVINETKCNCNQPCEFLTCCCHERKFKQTLFHSFCGDFHVHIYIYIDKKYLCIYIYHRYEYKCIWANKRKTHKKKICNYMDNTCNYIYIYLNLSKYVYTQKNLLVGRHRDMRQYRSWPGCDIQWCCSALRCWDLCTSSMLHVAHVARISTRGFFHVLRVQQGSLPSSIFIATAFHV